MTLNQFVGNLHRLHVDDSVLVGMLPGHHRDKVALGHVVFGDQVFEEDAVLGQLVNVGTDVFPVSAAAAQPIGAERVDGDPYDFQSFAPAFHRRSEPGVPDAE